MSSSGLYLRTGVYDALDWFVKELPNRSILWMTQIGEAMRGDNWYSALLATIRCAIDLYREYHETDLFGHEFLDDSDSDLLMILIEKELERDPRFCKVARHGLAWAFTKEAIKKAYIAHPRRSPRLAAKGK